MLRTDALEGQDLPCAYLARHELEALLILLLLLIAASLMAASGSCGHTGWHLHCLP